MFSTLGYFRQIRCPQHDDCALPNCIFEHCAGRPATSDELKRGDIHRSSEARDIQPPQPKRPRLDQKQSDASITAQVSTHHDSLPKRTETTSSAKSLTNSTIRPEPIGNIQKLKTWPKHSGNATKPVSVARPVTPPPTKTSIPSKRQERKEKLIPRPVPKAPAQLNVRLALLSALHKQLHAMNEKVGSEDGQGKAYKLSEQELITIALEEEERAAVDLSADVYRNATSQRILLIKKMSISSWVSYITDWTKQRAEKTETASDTSTIPTDLSTAEQLAVLNHLRTSLDGLDQYGYVTEPPTLAQIQEAKDAVTGMNNFEVCDRCRVRFQVFPGRDDQGRLTTRGSCTYHWAKLSHVQSTRMANMRGAAEAVYNCCNKPSGSEGCTSSDTHVFKVEDRKRLASVLQFERTPARSHRASLQPVAFDCEMAYTTFGLELIRLTAISWPEKQNLVDVLVHPYGEILDLNTRFSGITRDMYTNASPYHQDSSPASAHVTVPADAHVHAGRLSIVKSPAVARQLLVDLLDHDTPLIGHAIENDLNACRLIHPFIIDTVLLYPHPRGLPVRYGLKMLSAKYLGRTIQNAGAQGHDSKEDAVATADLVRVKVADAWKSLKAQGR